MAAARARTTRPRRGSALATQLTKRRGPRTWSAGLAGSRGVETVVRLLDQAERHRVAVRLAPVRLHRPDDRKNDGEKSHERQKEEPDPDAQGWCQHDGRDEHRELEVQRVLALIVDERVLRLLQEPAQQRPAPV